MCEHCNHERKLKVGDRVNVNWQKAVESGYRQKALELGFRDRSWVAENLGHTDIRPGTIIDLTLLPYYKVKFDNYDYCLWVRKDWLSLADESKTGE